MKPSITRRTLLAGTAASAVLPFIMVPRARAATPGELTFGLSSFPPSIKPWANTGTAAATIKLMIYRGLTSYADDGSLRPELAESWERSGTRAGHSSCAMRYFRMARRSPRTMSSGPSNRLPPKAPPPTFEPR